MNNNVASFKHVKRCVFNAIADRVEADETLKPHVSINYTGTNLYGAVTIDGTAGYSKEYQKALQIFIEEFCK